MSMEKYIVRVRDEKKTGPLPMIHNNSERTILLIPFYGCDNVKARSSGQLIDTLAITIWAGKSITVDWTAYDRTKTGSDVQTYILFRAPDTDDLVEYKKKLNQDGVETKDEEELLLCARLQNDLHLDCDEVMGRNACQVAGEGKKEDKEAIRKPVDPETLARLIKDVLSKQAELKEYIKALVEEMEILMEAWKSLDQNQTKLH